QPPPDPNLIVLVRRVRVRPTLIFQGRVEGDSLIAQNRTAPAVPAANGQQNGAAPTQTAKPPESNHTVVNRVRTFIKRLWNSNSYFREPHWRGCLLALLATYPRNLGRRHLRVQPR